MAILVAVLGACTSGPAESSREEEAQIDELERAQIDDQAPASGATSAEQAATMRTTPEVAQAQSGCAVVQTCDAAGPDGTRCRQQGCSVSAAELECELEAFSVCGAAVCPVILIKSDGTRENLCNGDRP